MLSICFRKCVLPFKMYIDSGKASYQLQSIFAHVVERDHLQIPAIREEVFDIFLSVHSFTRWQKQLSKWFCFYNEMDVVLGHDSAL